MTKIIGGREERKFGKAITKQISGACSSQLL